MTQLSPPSQDLVLTPIGKKGRTLREWLTTFHLGCVVLDPYTNESSWVLNSATRLMRHFSGAAVRVNFVIACGEEDAKSFLGPLADEFLVFTDPDRTIIKALGVSELPAFVLIQMNGQIPAAAQGWSSQEWDTVSSKIAELTSWSKPTLPGPGDPGPFHGTPAVA
jgi:hypothetical protein